MLNLDELALKYGTDKSSRYHDYCKTYDRLFHKLKQRPVTLLEIGVYGGSSLRMWKDYFRDGHIIGVDINSECSAQAEDRITIEIADQTQYTTTRELNIVIDDGSHNPDHFRKTFKNLWPQVKPGGYYCIEDLSVCNHPNYPKRWGKSLSEMLNGEITEFLTDSCAGRWAKSILFFPRLMVIEK